VISDSKFCHVCLSVCTLLFHNEHYIYEPVISQYRTQTFNMDFNIIKVCVLANSRLRGRQRGCDQEETEDALLRTNTSSKKLYLTNSLIPQRRDPLENSIVAQLVKKLPALHGTRRFIAVFVVSRYCTQS
jgi:hypothetical protein